MGYLRSVTVGCIAILYWPLAYAETATTAAHVDMGQCLKIASRQARPDEAICPGFIVSTLADARATCRDVGGVLRTHPNVGLWTIDVNGDGQPEYLFDFTRNVDCAGAPSVFSCGSLGCGLSLYGRLGGRWRVIGNVPEWPMAIELRPPARPGAYADLRVGCGEAECAEHQHFRWNGQGYELGGLEVRGHAVDLPATRGQIWMLVRDAAVLAEPRRGARTLERYKGRTEVVILGQARSAPYLYVSPCNACAPGFVEQALLRRGQAR